jgi:hypothetical protein
MIIAETNGTQVRLLRFPTVPPTPDTGACNEEDGGDECAMAWAIEDVRAALPDGETCTDEEARSFLSAQGANLGEGEPF